jgi:hypothetical protein
MLFNLLSGSTGLNNIVDPVRLQYDPKTGVAELAEAVNVDIDDTGRISRRPGQSLLDAGVYHSAFCDKADCFVVEDRATDAAIFKVATDFSLSGVRSGLTKAARISFCQVGGKTFYVNGYENGVIENGISAAWPTNTHVGPDTSRSYSPAPVGTKLAHFQGSMWVAQDNVIWVSEPYAYGKFDMARRFFQFGSNVTMMKPVAGGVWVSDEEKTGFIAAGDKFDDMRFIQRSPVPAHEWSENIELVDLSQTVFQVPGLSAVWSSNKGLCIGTEDGQLVVATEKKLVYPAGSQGATLVSGTRAINTVY